MVVNVFCNFSEGTQKHIYFLKSSRYVLSSLTEELVECSFAMISQWERLRGVFNQICFSRHPHSGCFVGGGTALELPSPQAAPGIIPKADIAVGCTESY